MNYDIDKTAIIFSFLLNISLKGVICILIAIVFYILAKDRSPKVKQIFLFTALLSFIFIPIVSHLLNFVFTFITTKHMSGSYYSVPSPVLDSLQRGFIEIPRQAEITRLLTPTRSFYTETHWSIWFLIIWSVGFVVTILRVIVGKLSLCYINRTATFHDSHLADYLEVIKQELGMKRQVRLLLSNRYQLPAAFSWLRPTIILPKLAENWSEKQLRPVLIHELTHINRFDCLIRDIALIVCSLFWFIPFVWIAYGKLKYEQEKICDINVIRFGSKPTDYAEQILFFAKNSIMKKVHAYAFIPIITKQLLRSRIEYILRIKDYINKRISHKLLLGLSLCSLLLLIPLSTINPFVMESDVEILADLKNSVSLDSSTDITRFSYEVQSNLRSLPVIWPVLDGLGDAKPGTYVDNKQSVRIYVDKWDYGIVIAVADGVITKVEPYIKKGYKVEIAHKNNIYSVYSPIDLCHNNNITVGSRICQGDIIGYFYKSEHDYKSYSFGHYYKKYVDFALKTNSDYINPMQALYTFNKKLYFTY
jgi:beta-lactamase regulating signal transducer with metallopeptidase domain